MRDNEVNKERKQYTHQKKEGAHNINRDRKNGRQNKTTTTQQRTHTHRNKRKQIKKECHNEREANTYTKKEIHKDRHTDINKE